MGQRLVVKVKKENTIIAAVYYHWGAYTIAALEAAKDFVKVIDSTKSIKDIQLSLIRFCESEGGCINGGVDSKEYKEISNIFPEEKFNEDGDRNCGLICLTENGIKELSEWSEGDLIIDLDNGMIENTVLFVEEEMEEVLTNLKEDYENINSIEDMDDIGIDISYFKISELDSVIDLLVENEDKMYFRFEDTVFSVIM